MNLILIQPGELPEDSTSGLVTLTGRRAAHIRDVHRAEVGAELAVGCVGGAVGRGRVVALENDTVMLDVALTSAPPPKLPLTVLLALPRPRVLKRALAAAAALGVEELILINAWRVEKSYWQTPVLAPDSITEHLTLGLEQARDTILPRVEQRKLFKPFVEDELPARMHAKRALVAHPDPAAAHIDSLPIERARPTVLCVGPEGGWLPYEVDKLIAAGAHPIQMGARIQRVEVALTALIAKLF